MQRETNTIINIEEVGEYGIIDIAAANVDDINRAIKRIKAITAVPEIGEIYDGVVKNIMPFGAFVEIIPGHDGLLHISEIEYRRLENVEDVLKVGDEIKVKLIAVDEKTGKLKLSHKVLLPKPEGYKEDDRPARPRPSQDKPRNDRPHNNNRPPRRD